MRPECMANRAVQGANLREYGNLEVVVAGNNAAAVEERAAVQFHHGVVVDVDHVDRGKDFLDYLVRVPDRRQPGTDIDELPHVDIAKRAR